MRAAFDRFLFWLPGAVIRLGQLLLGGNVTWEE